MPKKKRSVAILYTGTKIRNTGTNIQDDSVRLKYGHHSKVDTIYVQIGAALMEKWEWSSSVAGEWRKLDPEVFDSITPDRLRLMEMDHSLYVGRVTDLSVPGYALAMANSHVAWVPGEYFKSQVRFPVTCFPWMGLVINGLKAQPNQEFIFKPVYEVVDVQTDSGVALASTVDGFRIPDFFENTPKTPGRKKTKFRTVTRD